MGGGDSDGLMSFRLPGRRGKWATGGGVSGSWKVNFRFVFYISPLERLKSLNFRVDLKPSYEKKPRLIRRNQEHKQNVCFQIWRQI